MPYQALLFDLDNTLLDFTKSEQLSLDTIYAKYFQSHVAKDLFKEHYQLINRDLWVRVEAGQLATGAVKFERFRILTETLKTALDYRTIAQHYEENLIVHANCFPGVLETLEHLKKSYHLAVVTNGFIDLQQAKLNALKINEYCSYQVISDVVGVAKPNKAIFEITLQQMGLNAQSALMIGDSLSSDYLGAINAGIDFCWINRQSNPLPKEFPPPKYEIKSVNELPEVIG